MIHTQDKRCTGCGACRAACPVRAISMDASATGYYAPVVDESVCIHCKKCLKACPALNPAHRKEERPQAYAVAAQDEERARSSSGGFFPVLARYVLQQGGYVCGAAWGEDWRVHHVIIDTEEELAQLRYSKYVQSDTEECFTRIASLLQEGKLVLFSGTPCQNAGLLRYIGGANERLITADIICHGAPSPELWQKYLHENFDVDAITDICFRPKEKGWESTWKGFYDTDYAYIKEGGKKREIGVYYEAFLRHLLSNDCCVECPYRTVPRPSDFTMGDFWNYAIYDPRLNDGRGLSAVLVNTRKAQKIFADIEGRLKTARRIEIQDWEHIELSQHARLPEERAFVRTYRESPITVTKTLEAACRKRFDVAILSMINACNYGSALVAYSLQELLKMLGYTSVLINKRRRSDIPVDERNKSLEFAAKHCFLTRLYEPDESVLEVNEIADAFIVGSDTNWWWGDVCQTGMYYWLDFARADKRKIAFATSFAHRIADIPAELVTKLRYLYSRFDALSSREASGVDQLRTRFHVPAEHIYDPVLIAGEAVFSPLADESSRTDQNYIFAYMLDLTPEKEAALKHVADTLQLPLRAVPYMTYHGGSEIMNEIDPSVVDFVYLLKNASFVVTDSFHGTCFSTLFKKPFLSLVNPERGGARYDIFHRMGLSEHLVSHASEILGRKEFSLSLPDYTRAESVLKQEREKALSWLREAMEAPKPRADQADLLYDVLYEKRDANQQKRREAKKTKHIRFKYFKYRLLSLVAWGKRRKRYKEKKRTLRNLLKVLSSC